MTKNQLHPGSILIVDDNLDILLAAEIVLKKHFETILVESDPHQLLGHLQKHHIDVVLLDMNFQTGSTSGNEGLEWLDLIQEQAPNTKVILMTAFGGVDLAVRALKGGAVDFVLKPWDKDKMIATVLSACRYSQVIQELHTLKARQTLLDEDVGHEFKDIIGQSKALRDILQTVDKVANTDANILILGENGTGKELIARAIHLRSLRHKQSLVSVDLGAIPESLFESELFGHKKGAFTDAKQDRSGRFELANGGSLFLDEIGNLNRQSQAKLLGVLESRTITRMGSEKTIDLDVRLICATNMPLLEMVNEFQFRQDLLYRINTVEIHIPSLRERIDDIPLLVDHYITHFSNKYHRDVEAASDQTLRKLQSYHWPGNVRELKHAIERAVIMADKSFLSPDDFAFPKPAKKSETQLNLVELEKDAIDRALLKYDGNMSKAAEALGLGRATLYRKMSKYGL